MRRYAVPENGPWSECAEGRRHAGAVNGAATGGTEGVETEGWGRKTLKSGIAHVRLLCTNDAALTTDFTYRDLLSGPRGNVYKRPAHRGLIETHCATYAFRHPAKTEAQIATARRYNPCAFEVFSNFLAILACVERS